ncbi:NAD-dependent epimerase/dehydratase family protein [Paenibacillus sp. FSL H7-0737]|uniref:NAD-dependent epimerase/dehydratase family protein n=1 Tax=Paenibacillus sp. FSL H7-0737 TaxID=1536775 RepID=UPI0004F742EF|nr:NAD-dependent epimerase/dehydratase family protein [Paenibacillus sp. FSL H7-0737]AIQ25716.1 NAD-dependent epimerase [Paenibacillus sp. FSL H7-0737]
MSKRKILITGKESYIGTSFIRWIQQWPDKYSIDTLSVRDSLWKEKDFKGYDVVFHVAGIAHVKESKENTNLYYEVNRDLAHEVAQKTKLDGVKQFIFLSSMSVYGKVSGMIDQGTHVNPISSYGKSKLQAEKLITPMANENFRVAVLRPPMVYGKGCKGNYPKLVGSIKKINYFPNIKNQRSMIYVENLCEFVRHLIDDGGSGLYFPQNNEYVSTSDMVKLTAEAYGEKVVFINLVNPIIRLLRKKNIIVNKVFGDLTYEKKMSVYKKEYCVINFSESIKSTAGVE